MRSLGKFKSRASRISPHSSQFRRDFVNLPIGSGDRSACRAAQPSYAKGEAGQRKWGGARPRGKPSFRNRTFQRHIICGSRRSGVPAREQFVGMRNLRHRRISDCSAGRLAPAAPIGPCIRRRRQARSPSRIWIRRRRDRERRKRHHSARPDARSDGDLRAPCARPPDRLGP